MVFATATLEFKFAIGAFVVLFGGFVIQPISHTAEKKTEKTMIARLFERNDLVHMQMVYCKVYASNCCSKKPYGDSIPFFNNGKGFMYGPLDHFFGSAGVAIAKCR